MRRRDFLKLGAATGAAGLVSPRALLGAADDDRLKFLCPPDGLPSDVLTRPSPPSTPFVAPLNIPGIKQPVSEPLNPSPDPRAHQRYGEFLPKKFYEIHENEFLWQYHPEPPYDKGSWAWGFDGVTPGPTFQARYGEPVLVRMFNDLPPVGAGKIGFALSHTTTHLHNAHTASESDGFPMDFITPGEFWDHHYPNFPSRHDPREKLTTLWYHDHMMEFTATNVYAGLSGMYLLFDEEDSGDENDPNPLAFRLPSGKYDIPLILHDVRFDHRGQCIFNKLNTDGVLGDKYTVNRIIQPHLKVERRKYRFRILNGGPSRFYQIFLSAGKKRDKLVPFTVVTGDGNFLPRPLLAESLYLSVAQRADVVLDFSQFQPGDQLFLQNRLEQTDGKGPSGRLLEPGDDIMRFDVVEKTSVDRSRVPEQFRDLPPVNYDEVRRRRVWTFDYRGGMWTINGKPADSEMMRVDAAIEEDSAEIWTIRNEGKNWAHPVHSHFTEFLLLEVNGRKMSATEVQTTARDERRHNEFPALEQPTQKHRASGGDFQWRGEPIRVFMGGSRRDIATLLPNDEILIFMRWHDFHGRYVLHCHNVVHEDHAMMLRWDIVPKGKT